MARSQTCAEARRRGNIAAFDPHPSSREGMEMFESQASVQVAVPPDQLYAMVADVTRIPEWSPETVKTEWKEGSSRAEPGAHFVGRNKFGRIQWSMPCVIESAEPGRELTWSTLYRGRKITRWTYRFEPRDGGTEVTESYSESGRIPQPFHAIYGLMFRRHDKWMPENIKRSLERLKEVAESKVAAPAAGDR